MPPPVPAGAYAASSLGVRSPVSATRTAGPSAAAVSPGGAGYYNPDDVSTYPLTPIANSIGFNQSPINPRRSQEHIPLGSSTFMPRSSMEKLPLAVHNPVEYSTTTTPQDRGGSLPGGYFDVVDYGQSSSNPPSAYPHDAGQPSPPYRQPAPPMNVNVNINAAPPTPPEYSGSPRSAGAGNSRGMMFDQKVPPATTPGSRGHGTPTTTHHQSGDTHGTTAGAIHGHTGSRYPVSGFNGTAPTVPAYQIEPNTAGWSPLARSRAEAEAEFDPWRAT